MPKWFEITEAIRNLVEAADRRMTDLQAKREAERRRRIEAEARLSNLETSLMPIPADEWHEDHGTALWWRLPVMEPPYVGSPLDCDWTPDYYTHWTPLAPITPQP